MPAIAFGKDFDIERWLDWVIDVPTIFRFRARGLVPSGAVPFRRLMELRGCDELREQDWELHASTIFTDVRSYTYVEVRSADLQPDEHIFAVPVFWTGIFYHDAALDGALALGSALDYEGWDQAMQSAARDGLRGRMGERSLRDVVRDALALSARGLRDGAACVRDPSVALASLERLAARHELEIEN